MPIVNYVFIGLNILVFLLLQQLGSNEAFDYAFALVPKEITTGIDISGAQVISRFVWKHRPDPALHDAATRLFQLPQLDVHAREHSAYLGQHAVPLDIRRQS